MLRNRQPAYEMTLKVPRTATSHLVVRAHLPIVSLLGAAWLIGVVAGCPLPAIVHLWTAGVVLVSLALIATEWWPFPAPYDRRLWERQARADLRVDAQP